MYGNWQPQIQSVREKTFTHSCTYRQRHVAACRKPREWHLLLWDKAKPSVLLGSGYEACFGVGWRAPLSGGHLIFFQHAWTAWNTTLSPLLRDSHACYTLFPFGEPLLSTSFSGRIKSLDSFHHFGAGPRVNKQQGPFIIVTFGKAGLCYDAQLQYAHLRWKKNDPDRGKTQNHSVFLNNLNKFIPYLFCNTCKYSRLSRFLIRQKIKHVNASPTGLLSIKHEIIPSVFHIITSSRCFNGFQPTGTPVTDNTAECQPASHFMLCYS